MSTAPTLVTSTASATPEERGVAYYLVLNTASAEGNNDTADTTAGSATQHCCIGIKRYGGLYCQRCEISLLQEGEESARYAGKVHFQQCPLCEATVNSSAAAVDVAATTAAAAAPAPAAVTGSANKEQPPAASPPSSSPNDVVGECMCFDWLMAPHRLQQRKFRHRTIVDSYGVSFGVSFFLTKIVGACPVQFYDKIEQPSSSAAK